MRLVRWSPGMWQVAQGHWATDPRMVEANFSLWIPGLEYEDLGMNQHTTNKVMLCFTEVTHMLHL